MQELKQRLLVTQALEAARTVEEGVITDPREADVGSILGFGFAPYTGGALSYIDFMGAKAFVELCSDLAGEVRRALRAAEDRAGHGGIGRNILRPGGAEEKSRLNGRRAHGGTGSAGSLDTHESAADEIASSPDGRHTTPGAIAASTMRCRCFSDAEYRADRGAFFKSVHGTLNHLLGTDRIWMRRFTGDGEAPDRLDAILFETFADLRLAREAEDARITVYAQAA